MPGREQKWAGLDDGEVLRLGHAVGAVADQVVARGMGCEPQLRNQLAGEAVELLKLDMQLNLEGQARGIEGIAPSKVTPFDIANVATAIRMGAMERLSDEDVAELMGVTR